MKYRNLNFIGIMAYDGQFCNPSPERRQLEILKEEKILIRLVKEAVKYNDNLTVSVSGTPTFEIWTRSDDATELQPRTHIYYDKRGVKQNIASKGKFL